MGFLKETTGGLSSNRLIFMIGSIWTMATTTLLLFMDVDIPMVIAYFSALQGVWVALKLGQKPMENKK